MAKEVRRVVEVTVVPGTRKNSVRYNTECGDTLRLECMNRKIGFPCKMMMRDGVITINKQHGAATVNDCLDIARAPRMSRQEPKKILELARSRNPDARIQREKRANQPQPPTSIDEMLKSIEMYPEFEDDDVPGVAVIFLSLMLLSQLGQVNSMHLDETFRTLPGLLYQLLTIHIILFDKAFSVAFVLMSRKTRNLYTSVMQQIVRIYEERFPDVPISINDIVTDFELALMGAVSDGILDTEPRSCWFHYGQTILRKSGKLHLSRNYRNGGVVAHIIQELIGLALLPAERIYEGYEVKSGDTQRTIAALYTYWSAFWLGNAPLVQQTVSLNVDDVYLKVWDFIDDIKEAEESKSRDFQNAENGDPIGKGSTPAQRKRNRNIARNATLLESGNLSTRIFTEIKKSNQYSSMPVGERQRRAKERRERADRRRERRESADWRRERREPVEHSPARIEIILVPPQTPDSPLPHAPFPHPLSPGTSSARSITLPETLQRQARQKRYHRFRRIRPFRRIQPAILHPEVILENRLLALRANGNNRYAELENNIAI
ncbi:hypothetical protein GHT06_015285 [Daphnia sinensis]|uniref:MULE transposase domain-containing protein n=1 Tax=Daphnia sinensis TaxID=1820382 RepID=A0AAD5LIU4_9CRUS|nr:hypothetical protein GHT06_015285 [Daphnia sinensis]